MPRISKVALGTTVQGRDERRQLVFGDVLQFINEDGQGRRDDANELADDELCLSDGHGHQHFERTFAGFF